MKFKLKNIVLPLLLTLTIYVSYFLFAPEHLEGIPINWKHIVFDILFLSFMSFIIYRSNLWVSIKVNKYAKWDKQPLKRLVLQIFFSTLVTFLILLIFMPINLGITYILNPEIFSGDAHTPFEDAIGSLGLLFIVLFLFFQTIFLGYYFYRNWVKSLTVSDRLKKENIHSQLLALQNQANPHFLFNSLNTLTSLIEDDKDTAIEFVEQLSSFYRYLLQRQENHLSSLSDEMNFINAYIFLQSKRFGKNLTVDIQLDESIQNKFIPTFILQILLENAIKHNIVSKENPLHIRLYSSGNDKLIVENNIQPKLTKVESSGMGLQNIKNRYGILSGENIEIFNNGKIFKVIVPLFKDKYSYESADN